MKVEYSVYEDGVIAVALVAKDSSSAERQLFNLAIRYLRPESYLDRTGETVKVNNFMGGETDWFIVPHSFSVAIAKCLIEQKISGLPAFAEDGFARMIKWLIEMEEINDSMCY